MTDLKELNKNTYDFAIIGSNLHSLLVAYQLSRVFHKKVAIIENQDSLGGDDAPLEVNGKSLMSHFSKIADSEMARKSLTHLNEILNQTSFNEDIETPPMCIDSGKLIPFVGFGDRKFASMDILQEYSSSQLLQLESSPSEWIKTLESHFIGDIYSFAEVTKIEVEDEKFKFAVINGSRNLVADHFVYCLPPKSIKKVLPNEMIADKSFQKLLKNKTFSKVRLHLEHSTDLEVEERPFHIFYGNKDDYDPIIGQFVRSEERLESLWSCWTLSELIDDHEHLGGLFKHIKKQIKRVYPQIFENIVAEKIVVEMDSDGATQQQGLLEKPLAKVEGLWLCHPQLTDNTGLLGKLVAAQTTLLALAEQLGLENENMTIATEQTPNEEITSAPL